MHSASGRQGPPQWTAADQRWAKAHFPDFDPSQAPEDEVFQSEVLRLIQERWKLRMHRVLRQQRSKK